MDRAAVKDRRNILNRGVRSTGALRRIGDELGWLNSTKRIIARTHRSFRVVYFLTAAERVQLTWPIQAGSPIGPEAFCRISLRKRRKGFRSRDSCYSHV